MEILCISTESLMGILDTTISYKEQLLSLSLLHQLQILRNQICSYFRLRTFPLTWPWVTIWRFKVLLRPNPLKQMLQKCSLGACVFLCLIRLVESAQAKSHLSHLCGFSPVCVRVWISNDECKLIVRYGEETWDYLGSCRWQISSHSVDIHVAFHPYVSVRGRCTVPL